MNVSNNSFNRLIGKNSAIHYKLKSIGGFKRPVETRWGWFLNFLRFTVNNRVEIVNILRKHKDNKSAAFKNTWSKLNNDEFMVFCKAIDINYYFLAGKIKTLERKSFSIEEGMKIMEDIYIKHDLCGLKDYIKKRILKHIFH